MWEFLPLPRPGVFVVHTKSPTNLICVLDDLQNQKKNCSHWGKNTWRRVGHSQAPWISTSQSKTLEKVTCWETVTAWIKPAIKRFIVNNIFPFFMLTGRRWQWNCGTSSLGQGYVFWKRASEAGIQCWSTINYYRWLGKFFWRHKVWLFTIHSYLLE